MSELIVKRPRKRSLIGLLFLAAIIISLACFAIWRISAPGLGEINAVLPTVLCVIVGILSACMLLGLVNVSLAIKGMPFIKAFQHQTYSLINFLFPLAVKLGKLFGLTRRQLENSFIQISNILFSQRNIKVPADRLLVVTPHCLQLASCPHKITRDPNNCKRCGGCNIGDLLKLSEEMGFHFFVATGGTLARQIVKNTKPKAVLAIACERDLMSGIQDVYPLPAVGVLNIRPNGPCYNTKVDMAEIRTALEKIIIKEETTTEGNEQDNG